MVNSQTTLRIGRSNNGDLTISVSGGVLQWKLRWEPIDNGVYGWKPYQEACNYTGLDFTPKMIAELLPKLNSFAGIDTAKTLDGSDETKSTPAVKTLGDNKVVIDRHLLKKLMKTTEKYVETLNYQASVGTRAIEILLGWQNGSNAHPSNLVDACRELLIERDADGNPKMVYPPVTLI